MKNDFNAPLKEISKTFATQVMQMEGEYGLIVDSTPTLCRIWPLAVGAMNLGGQEVQTAMLTCATVDEAKRFELKETQVKSKMMHNCLQLCSYSFKLILLSLVALCLITI